MSDNRDIPVPGSLAALAASCDEKRRIAVKRNVKTMKVAIAKMGSNLDNPLSGKTREEVLHDIGEAEAALRLVENELIQLGPSPKKIK